MHTTRPDYAILKAAGACLFITLVMVAVAIWQSGCTTVQNPPPPVRMVPAS